MKKLLGLLLIFCMLMGLCPAAFAAEYEYEVNGIYFTDLAGNAMENPGRSCVINVEVTKKAERIGNELVVITAYSTDGEMVTFTTVSGTMQKDEKEIFSTLMFIPEDKDVGIVKAFVWNNISEMRAMSVPFEKMVNEMDDGVDLPDVNNPPVAETYIPSTVTVEGMITGTSVTGNFANGEYSVTLYPVELKVDDVYTEEEYNARVKRTRAICGYYNIPFALDGEVNIAAMVHSDIDLDSYLFNEGTFELRLVDKKYEVVAFEPKESNNIIYLQAEDYVKQSNQNQSDRYSCYRALNFGGTYYQMEYDGFNLYINGALYMDDIKHTKYDIDKTLDTVFGKALGQVKMVKQNGGYYYTDVFVECFEIATVTGVEYIDGERAIYFETRNPIDTSYDEIVISDEYLKDGRVSAAVTKNGSEADLSSVAEGDIIAYAIDYTDAWDETIYNPKKIKLLATNKTVTGKVTRINEDEKTVTVSGEVYKCIGYEYEYVSVGGLCDLILDPFDRIMEIKYYKFHSESRFAVVQKGPVLWDVDDELSGYMIETLYNGRTEQELILDDDLFYWDEDFTLNPGDVFFFDTDSNGLVREVYIVHKSGTEELISLEDAGVYRETLPQDSRGWSYNLWNEGKDIQLVCGYIVDVNSDEITLTTTTAVDNGYIDTTVDIDDADGHTKGVATFGIDRDCVAYEYDKYNDNLIKTADKFSAKDPSSIEASSFDEYVDNAKVGVFSGELKNDANYAITMIVDGEIVEIYTIPR